MARAASVQSSCALSSRLLIVVTAAFLLEPSKGQQCLPLTPNVRAIQLDSPSAGSSLNFAEVRVFNAGGVNVAQGSNAVANSAFGPTMVARYGVDGRVDTFFGSGAGPIPVWRATWSTSQTIRSLSFVPRQDCCPQFLDARFFLIDDESNVLFTAVIPRPSSTNYDTVVFPACASASTTPTPSLTASETPSSSSSPTPSLTLGASPSITPSETQTSTQTPTQTQTHSSVLPAPAAADPAPASSAPAELYLIFEIVGALASLIAVVAAVFAVRSFMKKRKAASEKAPPPVIELSNPVPPALKVADAAAPPLSLPSFSAVGLPPPAQPAADAKWATVRSASFGRGVVGVPPKEWR